jgi:hypothetical protein
VRAVLREVGLLLDPHLGTAVDDVIAGAARLSQVAPIYQKHAANSGIEITQFRELLKANFASDYLSCCHHTIEETTLGFEGRAHEFLRRHVADVVLRRRYRSLPPGLPGE